MACASAQATGRSPVVAFSGSTPNATWDMSHQSTGSARAKGVAERSPGADGPRRRSAHEAGAAGDARVGEAPSVGAELRSASREVEAPLRDRAGADDRPRDDILRSMSQLVLAIRAEAGQRAVLEAHARRAITGDWWAVADIHTVEARLEFAPTVITSLALGFHADVNCRDPQSPIAWTTEPYTLFAASGDWDESAGLAALDALSAWLTEVLPNVRMLHAGLSTPEVELTLRPALTGWVVSERY